MAQPPKRPQRNDDLCLSGDYKSRNERGRGKKKDTRLQPCTSRWKEMNDEKMQNAQASASSTPSTVTTGVTTPSSETSTPPVDTTTPSPSAVTVASTAPSTSSPSVIASSQPPAPAVQQVLIAAGTSVTPPPSLSASMASTAPSALSAPPPPTLQHSLVDRPVTRHEYMLAEQQAAHAAGTAPPPTSRRPMAGRRVRNEILTPTPSHVAATSAPSHAVPATGSFAHATLGYPVAGPSTTDLTHYNGHTMPPRRAYAVSRATSAPYVPPPSMDTVQYSEDDFFSSQGHAYNDVAGPSPAAQYAWPPNMAGPSILSPYPTPPMDFNHGQRYDYDYPIQPFDAHIQLPDQRYGYASQPLDVGIQQPGQHGQHYGYSSQLSDPRDYQPSNYRLQSGYNCDGVYYDPPPGPPPSQHPFRSTMSANAPFMAMNAWSLPLNAFPLAPSSDYNNPSSIPRSMMQQPCRPIANQHDAPRPSSAITAGTGSRFSATSRKHEREDDVLSETPRVKRGRRQEQESVVPGSASLHNEVPSSSAGDGAPLGKDWALLLPWE